MIYLFCNRSFGAPFIDAAAKYAARTGAAITAVSSGRSENGALQDRSANWFAPLLAMFDRINPNNNGALRQLVVADVNAPPFFDSIQPGDAGIIAGFGQIFSAATIGRFASFVNIH